MSFRCSFPENHPLFQGFLDPERGAISDKLAGHDLVLVLGAPAFTYHVDRGRGEAPLPPLFIVSDDEQILARAFEGTGIRATPKLGVRALLNAVDASGRPAPAPLKRPAKPSGRSSPAGSSTRRSRTCCRTTRSSSRRRPATAASCTTTCRSPRPTPVS